MKIMLLTRSPNKNIFRNISFPEVQIVAKRLIASCNRDKRRKKIMPLKKSISKAAFKENIKAEVNAGKPIKQAVAIAYSEKRAAAKKKK